MYVVANNLRPTTLMDAADDTVPTTANLFWLVQRADFNDPLSYPRPDEPNMDIWAWEFMRRNTAYSLAWGQVLDDPSKADAVALAWGLSAMVDPLTSGADFRRVAHYLPLDEPFVVKPTFEADDLTAGMHGTPGLRQVRVETVPVTSHQILVRWNLDGNDEVQRDELMEYLKALKGGHGKATNSVVQSRQYVLVDDSESSESPFKAEVSSKDVPPSKARVIPKSFWNCLRCLDALAYCMEQQPEPDLSPDDWAAMGRDSDPGFSLEDWRDADQESDSRRPAADWATLHRVSDHSVSAGDWLATHDFDPSCPTTELVEGGTYQGQNFSASEWDDVVELLLKTLKAPMASFPGDEHIESRTTLKTTTVRQMIRKGVGYTLEAGYRYIPTYAPRRKGKPG